MTENNTDNKDLTINVTGSIAPRNDSEQEVLTVIHGGDERFFMFKLTDNTDPDAVDVQMFATGLNPEQLPTLLRDLANGMEAGNRG